MKRAFKSSFVFPAVLSCLAAMAQAHAAQGQAFAGVTPIAGLEGTPPAFGSPDGLIFAEGTRAINEGRWADAVTIFSRIAEQRSDHADGALYWKAYAENKLGQTGPAMEACAALRRGYPRSSWLDECGALEIEIHAKSGKPLKPKPDQSDDLKLLELNSLLETNAILGREQLEQILNDEDSSQRLKEGAQFLLGQHHTGIAYAQIARISYVEGDVRIARGRQNEKITGAEWEKAAANTPLQSGFNLVTGAGRAEIELEDASTLYLGENSVLSLNDLHSTDGVPFTELALLAGTVSLHVRPYVPGEIFLLRTPTDDNLMSLYPDKNYLRVTSFADATAITPLEGGVLRIPGTTQPAVIGQTLFFRANHRIDSAGAGDPSSYSDWDKWVADRVQARSKAMTETMEAAGLAYPIPGLAEMQGQGKFFDCAPYGTCWEPTTYAEMARAGIDTPPPGTSDASAQPPAPGADAAGTAQQPAAVPGGPRPAKGLVTVDQLKKDNAAGRIPSQTLTQTRPNDDDEFFPCYPDAVGNRAAMDPVAGFRRLTDASTHRGTLPYAWAVCHAGYWINHRNHYVWVVGKRHHHEPFHWVKNGRTVAFVPIHPRDVKGELPVNGKEKVFAIGNKNGPSIEPVKFDPSRPIALLKEPPREFRSADLPPLARAEEPHIAAHSFKDPSVSKSAGAPAAGIQISFDHKTQSFVMAHQVMQGERSTTVYTPITNRTGNLQSRASSPGGAGGSGGSSGSHAGSAGGGSSSGSHTSSGGSSSSTASSSSGSTGGGSSGGSHH